MNYTLHHGDNREVLRSMPSDSVDSIVCDPPYELGFMGKRWDSTGIAYDVTLWAECLRVLKPGGHLIAFGGTRTYHRMTCAIEDAGFEIRDCIMWLYGCLDEQTRIVTRHGVKQYNRIKVGDTVLCYNIDKSQYQYEQVQEVVVYDYHDTAYRLIGDFGEQVVSRNHRVIVERNGSEVFIPAEALQSEERIPILENMRSMQSSISDTQSYPAIAQSSLFEKLRQSKTFNHSHWSKEENICQGCGAVRGMRQNNIAVPISNKSSQGNDLQSSVQWEITSNGISKTFSQSTSKLDARIRTTITPTNDRKNQSVMERWRDVSQTQGIICESANQVRALSSGVFVNGTLGRVCDGTSNCGCTNNQATIESHGSGASHQSRRNGQQHQQSDAVCEQCRTQNIRTSQIHKTTMVRVVPFTYTGKVWCVRVPSGAFVAERNGAYFPTGNSGFPKSHNLHGEHQGWGTALKPAHEPIVVARKPLQGTVADNVQAWGVGGINVDGCRVGGDDGRWPANIIFDEEAAQMLDEQSGERKSAGLYRNIKTVETQSIVYQENMPWTYKNTYANETGGASRFFYVAKASKAEREAGLEGMPMVRESDRVKDDGVDGDNPRNRTNNPRINHHPTVKPIALMRYLVRMVTPRGGVVLDPFMGSGSTGCAAMLEAMQFIGIELSEEYIAIAQKRIEFHEYTMRSTNPMGL